MIRFVLWFVFLFVIACLAALLIADDMGMVTVFVYPWRIDLSLNLVLVLGFVGFIVLYFALRSLAALLHIPVLAKRWRVLRRERLMHTNLLDALTQLFAGRFIRSKKSSERILLMAQTSDFGEAQLLDSCKSQLLAHLLAAESAHALADRETRDAHLGKALKLAQKIPSSEALQAVELRLARWAYEDQKPSQALLILAKLPDGGNRRIIALRLKLKACRMAGKSQEALETIRLLSKHHGHSPVAIRALTRELITDLFNKAHDSAQVKAVWSALMPQEKVLPDVVLMACERLYGVGGDAAQVRDWLLPLWDVMIGRTDTLALIQRIKLARLLERSFQADYSQEDTEWLKRIELAQQKSPQDGVLQFLAGVVCLRLKLWGKSQQLLQQARQRIADRAFQLEVWRALAMLAEQQDDIVATNHAYRELAKYV